MKCFVYCEWIDDERLRISMPDAQLIDKVTLLGHRLIFTSFVEDGDNTVQNGGCHLVEAEGFSVPGLLYELSMGEQQIAEKLSRVKEGRYTPADYRVVDSGGTSHDAIAYVIKHPKGPSTASSEYREHMLNGARKHNFPEEYVKQLESI